MRNVLALVMAVVVLGFGSVANAVPSLFVNFGDGTATLDNDGLTLNGIQIKSKGVDGVAGSGVDGYLSGAATLPASFFTINTADEASVGFVNITTPLNLGQLIDPADLGVASVADLSFTYTVAGTSGQFAGAIIPEPASLALLGLGALAMIRRR